MANNQLNKKDINVLIKTKIVPNVAKKLRKSFDNVTWEITNPENTFFLSDVIFVHIHFKSPTNTDITSNSKDNSVQIVIKKPGSVVLNDVMHNEALFHNEILFYNHISNNNHDFPQYFYSYENENCLENTIIVMENIASRGFQLCPQVYDIPFEYVISAMQTIGRLHAMCYVMKEHNPRNFFKIVNDIKEPRYYPGDKFSEYINEVAVRPVEWLQKQNYDPNFTEKMDKHLKDAFTNVMMDAIQPVEPLAVICHGDFTRNNLFFRKNDAKLESMLIDFAMLRYSSPSIDLSTFLYLNCSKEDRTARFNEIFRAYHDALMSGLRRDNLQDLDKYSYDKMVADYKRRAMFGFIISTFYTPILKGYHSIDMENIGSFDPKVSGGLVKAAGGDVLSQEFAEILLELRDTGCLDHVINAEESNGDVLQE